MFLVQRLQRVKWHFSGAEDQLCLVALCEATSDSYVVSSLVIRTEPRRLENGREMIVVVAAAGVIV